MIANDTKAPFGEALVLADGAWQIAGSLNLEKTKHLLKFELVNDRGKIIANYTLPLTSRDLAKGQNGTRLLLLTKGMHYGALHIVDLEMASDMWISSGGIREILWILI